MVEARRSDGGKGGGSGEGGEEREPGYDGEALVLGTTNRWDRLSQRQRVGGTLIDSSCGFVYGGTY